LDLRSTWRSVAEVSAGNNVSQTPTVSGFRYFDLVSMLLGYARVSTDDQDAALQVDALKKAGCSKVFVDTASGALAERPELSRLLDQARAGDTLVVWRLDRLGRSIKHLIASLTDLNEREIGFRSLTENIDTTTPGGRLVFHIFAAMAEFERDLIRERTRAGLAAARQRGRQGGRPPTLSAKQVKTARELYDQRDMTVEQIGEILGVSRTTIYRALRQAQPAKA
jgi:DNA invertase Pin-like site-specific DNA recombinase